MPTKQQDLPSTLQRSAKKIQRTFAKARDSAEETYDSAERANRTAWAAVKHIAEKVGDHWELKDEPGPSDRQAARSGPEARRRRPTAGGVDASKSKADLYEQAKRAGIEGRSTMSKGQLVEALKKANDRATRRARS